MPSFEPVMRLLRGIRDPVIEHIGPLEQLVGIRGAVPNKMINTMKGATWWTDNPYVANSYVWRHGGANSVLIPADLVQKPEIVLDAGGMPWRDFFSTGKGARQFKQGMRDPDVKSILVNNIVDPGGQWWDEVPNFMSDSANKGMSLIDLMDKYYLGNNVLVKDPSVLRYISKEPANYARGGLARY